MSTVDHGERTSFIELFEKSHVAAVILHHLSFIDLQNLRTISRFVKVASEKHMDEHIPSLVVLGGLEIELDDDDRKEPPGVISPRVNVLRFSTMQWYTLPSLPTPRFSCAVCTLLDGRIVVAGGVSDLNGDNAIADPACFVEAGRIVHNRPYEESGNQWTWRGRNSQRGKRCNVVEIFDPETGIWSTLPPLPIPRSGEYYDTFDEESREFTSDIEVFCIASNRWIDTHDYSNMNHSRAEFALSRIEGLGIMVIGGTNRYLLPNSPITAELYSFQSKDWLEIKHPPNLEYDSNIIASKPEMMGGNSVLLENKRHIVYQGGMHVECLPWHVPSGSNGNDSDSEQDVFFEAGEDDYDGRLQRDFGMHVYDLDSNCWLGSDHERNFNGIGRARAGSIVWRVTGDTIFVGGGNYQFYSASDHSYPKHSSHEQVYMIDGPKGKRIALPWSKCLRCAVFAAGTAKLHHIEELALKHGWQDLHVGAEVELHDMKNSLYNGRTGKIKRDVLGGASGRWGVLLDGEKRPISVRAKCLRVLN